MYLKAFWSLKLALRAFQVEAYSKGEVEPRELETTLRMEYRSRNQLAESNDGCWSFYFVAREFLFTEVWGLPECVQNP